jgi:hypothetical protein
LFTDNVRVRIAALIIGLQSAVLWALAVWSVISIFAGDTLSLTSAWFLTGMLLAGGIWTANLAIGVTRFSRRSHTPAMIIQLLIASIGVASFGGQYGNFGLGALLLLPSAIAFYLLFSKSVRERFKSELSE